MLRGTAQNGGQQAGNGGNGENGGNPFEGMTLPELARILFEEIVRIREELKEEIVENRKTIRAVETRLGKVEERLGGVEGKLDALHMTVHQNHTAFIRRQEDLEKRLEAAGAQR